MLCILYLPRKINLKYQTVTFIIEDYMEILAKLLPGVSGVPDWLRIIGVSIGTSRELRSGSEGLIVC